jgi:superfamily II DNA/RNA helicase
MSNPTFGALGVPADLVTQLRANGIVTPFPIQCAVIPDALRGCDVTGRAPTGSGKTLAFGIPLVAGLRPAHRRRPTALVLAPTRELAQQIADEVTPLARHRKRGVAALYGGVAYGPQRKRLDAGVEVVVACPGRLEDLISTAAVSLGDVRYVVVDEADRMSDMGFLPAVKRLLAQTHPERQVLLFSATLDGAVSRLASEVQRRPLRHEVGPEGPDMSAARHVFWSVRRESRPELTARVARDLGSTMVFCRTRHGADRLTKQLSHLGVSAAPIHGGRSQAQRNHALRTFAGGQVSVLVATDVASRGVHVDDVAAVVHYDPPADAATYVHRSGRTARAGASGVVVSLVEHGTERASHRLRREVGVESAVVEPSTATLRAPGDDVPNEPAAVEPQVGTVAFLNEGRGYGFIETGTGPQLFVHHTNMAPRLAAGQRVEFSVRPGRKGPEAFDVRALDVRHDGGHDRAPRRPVGRSHR